MLIQLSTATLGGIGVSASSCQPANSPLCRLQQVKNRKHAVILGVLSGPSERNKFTPDSGEPMAVIVPKQRVASFSGVGRPAATLVPSAAAGSAISVSPAATLGPGGSRSQADAGVTQVTNGTAELTRVGSQVTTLRDTTADRRGVSVSGGLAVAADLQVATPLGTFKVSDANAHTVNKNKRLPLPLPGARRRKQ